MKLTKIQLQEKAQSIQLLIGFLEDITWLDIPDDETRFAIIELIQIAKRYHSEEEANVSALPDNVRRKEFKDLVLALDDLNETIQDVESAIITLPKLDGYNEIFDELSRL